MQAEARRGWISELAWAPNGQALALASATGVALYAFTQGKLNLRNVLEGHAGPVKGIAVSADGALLASAGADRLIHLRDLRQGGALRVLAGHEGSVERVAFAPDGAQLASAGADGTCVCTSWQRGANCAYCAATTMKCARSASAMADACW